ncbi:hypothetical protein C7M84_025098 [Penaeus vannamei]|uniref:Uncharacterized protein n=1 Tax=Penaeus vannamei TaxID=6689 RepID=A0A3R7MHB1_PENVA|nr:hypothetical protein C7M84_025098 [Penaeus vannamei]
MVCKSADFPCKRRVTRLLCFLAVTASVMYTAVLLPSCVHSRGSASSASGGTGSVRSQTSTEVQATRANLRAGELDISRSSRRRRRRHRGESGSRGPLRAPPQALLRNHATMVNQTKVSAGGEGRGTFLSALSLDGTQDSWRERGEGLWWDGAGECGRTAGLPSEENVTGTCGRRAARAGHGQRVISLSLYGDNSEYWGGLKFILEASTKLYPGWTVRLHTDPRGHEARLCPLLRRHPHLHVCDVQRLPALGDVRDVNPMLWRAAPLGDPQVATLTVRDVDSALLPRDAEAVQEWLALNKTWHVMRDFEGHGFRILGGLWGARSWSRRHAEELARLRSDLFACGRDRPRAWGQDQVILAEILWPAMQGDQVAHDSYFCQMFPETRPFPTERRSGEFVGAIR